MFWIILLIVAVVVILISARFTKTQDVPLEQQANVEMAKDQSRKLPPPPYQ